MPERTCSVEGCDKAHRARGYCSTHYNQQHQPQRHAKVSVPCAWCEKPCEKEAARANRYGALFCSLVCRDAWRKATGINPAPDAAARAKGRATLNSKRYRAEARQQRAARGTSGRRWVAGRCRRCGRAFVAQYNPESLASYCRKLCKDMDKAQRYERRKRAGRSEPYSRLAVFERDRWRCHVCRKRTDRKAVAPDPRAPTIDHLVPLAEGGDDTTANVATACFMCNSTRGNRGGGEQLALM